MERTLYIAQVIAILCTALYFLWEGKETYQNVHELYRSAQVQ